jgi:hypothetical protein
MAGGPIFPYSAVPSSDDVYPVMIEGGTNSREELMLGVEASLGANAIWQLTFLTPISLPTGTGKLQLWARANATSGDAKVNAKWASVAAEEDPDTVTLNAEGTSTLSWSTGDAYQYKELEITLDADTIVAGEVIYMDLTFETSSWTLAAESGWIPRIIWE